jgi:hypothetical protein
MCRYAQEASDMFRNLNNCIPVTQLGIKEFYKVFREVAVLTKMNLERYKQ